MPVEKSSGKTAKAKLAKPSGTPRSQTFGASILEEIGFSSKKRYTFYLTAHGAPVRAGFNQQLTIFGKIQDVGADWVRVRESSGYREHKDHIVPLASILYFTERFQGES